MPMKIEHNLMLWDFGGQERFKFMIPQHLKGTDLIVYVINSDLGKLDKSLEYIKNNKKAVSDCLGSKNVPEMYVATKSDLLEDEYDKSQLENKLIKEFPGVSINVVSNITGEGISDFIIGVGAVLSAYHKISDSVMKTLKEKDVLNGDIIKTNSKVAIIGNGGAGKTTLVEKLITGKYNADTKLTVGVDFKVLKLDLTTFEE
ncbi:MAG: ADP-ribosylation factor-like protein [Candidatus Nanoarchaeia archaeon]|nr:ADP-ribosylation factor-like protein [Candidatus Nanoarchaeia archaeon]